MTLFDHLAERLIQGAVEGGARDHLPGPGEPLAREARPRRGRSRR